MGYVIAITGDSASGKSTLAELLKDALSDTLVLECDRYHKWERGDPHWKTYTHLNPDANWLSKMQADVAALKTGQPIQQVDYDHSNGKFTEARVESPAANIIVCGLHSFYTEDHIYDLKVFMDTDSELRVKWKIERDTAKRNHSPEQVLKQIQSRQEDFERYVLPQKALADLVVNFYPREQQTGLALFIRRKYDLQKILKSFRDIDIRPTTVSSVDADFYILDFAEANYEHIVSAILFIREQGMA